MVVRISKVTSTAPTKYIHKLVFNTFLQNKCDIMDIKEKLKIIVLVSILLSTTLLVGCVSKSPSGYAEFKTVVFCVGDTYNIEQTKYDIELKDVTEEKCVLYIYNNGEIYDKAFFRYDNDNGEDFEFDSYRIRFVDGTDQYAKLKIYKENEE